MNTNLIPFQDVQGMAQAIAKSGLFGMKSADQALALMLVAQAEGQHPATITQDYDIIQGRAARKTHSVLARFQQMGGVVKWHELTDTIADATFAHKSGGELRISWTFEQAKKAGLTGKDNWRNYPRAMLRARCVAEGVRAVYPAALGGMMVSEEAQDLPVIDSPPKTINPDTPGEILQFDLQRALIEVAAAPTKQDLEAIWKKRGAEAKDAKDLDSHATLKVAVLARKAELEAPAADVIDAPHEEVAQ